MNNSSSLVLWFVSSLLNAGGVLAGAHAWNTRFISRYLRLLWLVPSILLAAWLAAFFGNSSVGQSISSLAVPFSIRAVAINLAAYLGLGLVFLLIRRASLKRTAAQSSLGSQAPMPIAETSLRQAVDSFLAAADSADTERLAATYAPDFLCIRVADAGGFVRLTAEQMLSFLASATSGKAVGHVVPARNSAIHHAEVLGNFAVVLISRTKDLGSGWEPIFYTLLWKNTDSSWRLQREIVHQRSIPNWSGLPSNTA